MRDPVIRMVRALVIFTLTPCYFWPPFHMGSCHNLGARAGKVDVFDFVAKLMVIALLDGILS